MVTRPLQALYQPFYTKSDALVNYMLEMLSVKSGMRIFEPSAGDGVFIDALINKVPDISLEACELNPEAATFLKKRYSNNKHIHVRCVDTLTDETLTLYANSGGYYYRIIANPPYGAWQDYDKRRDLKKMYPRLYVKETYALFLYRCIQLLADEGKLVFIIPDTFLNLHMHTALREYILTNTKIKELALFPSSFFPNVNFGYSDLSIITLEKCRNKSECLTNEFNILTGFKKAEELSASNNGHLKIYNFRQEDVFDHADHAFFVTDNVVNSCLSTQTQTIGSIADCVTGIYSGNDKRFLRPVSYELRNSKNYCLLETEYICTDYSTKRDILDGINAPDCFIPIVKGGAIKYLKPDIWYIDWSTSAVKTYKTDKKARFQNSSFYFKFGIGIPMVSSSQVTAALIENKLFDQSIVGVFPKDPEWIYFLLAFFNSPTCNLLLRTINPSANNSANYIKKIPFIVPNKDTLEFINIKMEEIVSSLKNGNKYNKETELAINNLIRELYGF